MAAKRHHHKEHGYGHAGHHSASTHESGHHTSPMHRHEDDGMIHEDHRAIANMPQEVMMKPYPMTGPYMPEDIDDTIRGVDRQMDMDDSDRRKTFKPRKV